MEQENKLAKETTVLVETYTLPDGREIKVIIDTLSARTKMFGIFKYVSDWCRKI